jgi:hypothetical protein
VLQLLGADRRPPLWGRAGRERSRVGIEPELFFPDADHVAAREDPLALYLLFVDERAVGAGVDHDVAAGRLDDLRMPAGHVFSGNHDVAPGLTAEHQRRAGDHVLAPVREAHHAATGCTDPRGLPAGARLSPSRLLGHAQGLHILRASGATLVHEGQLVVADLDFVAV